MSIQRIDEGNKEEPTMIRSRKNAGFTLIELMIVVAIIAIIASIAIPKLMSARLAANEAAAIATLRSVSSAQAQISMDARRVIDLAVLEPDLADAFDHHASLRARSDGARRSQS